MFAHAADGAAATGRLSSTRDAVRDSPIGSDARFWSGRLGFESLSRSSLAPRVYGAFCVSGGCSGQDLGQSLLTKSARSEALHKLVRWLQRSDPGRRPTPLPVGRLRFGGAGATTRPHRVVVRSKSSSTSSPIPTRRPCLRAWRRFAIGACGPPVILTAISGRSGWTAIGSSTASCFAEEGSRGQILLALDGFNKKTQKTPPATIELAKRRLADWRRRGDQKRVARGRRPLHQ